MLVLLAETELADIPMIIGVYDDTTKPIMYSTNQILTDTKLYNLLKSNINFSFSLGITGPYVIPTCLSEEDRNGDNENVLTLNGDYSLEKLIQYSKSEKEFSEFMEVLKENEFGYLTKNMLLDMLSDAEDFTYLLENMQFKYILDSSVNRDVREVAEEYNEESSGEVINYTTKKNEKTIVRHQKTPEDIINLNLPRPDYMTKREEFSVNMAQALFGVYSQSVLFNPYPELDENHEAITAANYKEILAEIEPTHINGSYANNELELQDNEEVFYNRLNNFIDGCLDQQIKETDNLDGFGSKEELLRYYKDNAILNQNVYLSSVITAIVRMFVNKNWSHSSLVPVGELSDFIGNNNENEESEEGNNESATDNKNFVQENSFLSIYNRKSKEFRDYVEVISEFINANHGTIYSWSEVIIKLARWGNRKPNTLILTFDKSKSNKRCELDLKSMEYSKSENSISQEVVDIEGCDYLARGVIYSPTSPVNLLPEKEFMDILKIDVINSIPRCPIGMVLSQKIKVADHDEYRDIYVDLYELANMIFKKGKTILGIEVLNDDSLDFITQDDIVENEFYTYDAEAVLFGGNNISKKFLQDREAILKFAPNISKEDMKACNMITYLKNIAQTQRASIFFAKNSTGDLVKFYRHMTPLYLKYFKSMEELGGIESLTLSECMEAFLQFYTGNELNSLNKATSTQAIVEKTSVFTKEEKDTVEEEKKPVVRRGSIFLKLSNGSYYFVVEASEQAISKGYKQELIYKPSAKEVVYNKETLKQQAGLLALKTICTLGYLKDNIEKSPIYVSPEVYENILDDAENIAKTRELLTAINVITRALAKKTK